MNNFIIICTRCGLERAIHNSKINNKNKPQTNIKVTTCELEAKIECKCGNKAEIQSGKVSIGWEKHGSE